MDDMCTCIGLELVQSRNVQKWHNHFQINSKAPLRGKLISVTLELRSHLYFSPHWVKPSDLG